MKKKVIVKQEGLKDCGACSLLSIIKYFGGNISISKLIALTNTTKNGTTFLDLKYAANYLNMNAVGYKIEKDLPKNIKLPFICQVIKNNYTHFIVVYEVKNNKVLVMDPSIGKKVLSKDEFLQIWTKNIMIFEPYKKLPYYDDKNHLKQIILNTILKNKQLVINILILSIIYTILSVLNSYQLKFFLDYINVNNNFEFFKYISLSFLIIIIIRSLSNVFRNHLLIYINEKIDINIFMETINNILYLPYNYYKNKTTGEVTSKINDISYVRNIISKITLTVLLDFLLMVTCGIILYLINLKLFVISICIVLFYIIILILFNPKIKESINNNLEDSASLNINLIEQITSFETVKGLNIENIVSDKLECLYTKNLKNIFKFNKLTNISNFLKEFIELVGLLAINIIGIYYINKGIMEISNLIVFNNILIYFLDPIKNIVSLNGEFHLAKSALKRANTLFEIKKEEFKESKIKIKNGNIDIQNLSFSYGNKKVLKDINISIKDKEKILIMGTSGSGKSTLLKILYKYYCVDRNCVFVNGYDICDYELSDIRKNIVYITQNEMLYTKSVKENIKLERKIEEKEFLNIAKLCCVDDIVKDNILGYDMLLEENGINISGGQRQRIILARSLLKNSKMIFIDEGFNQIDTKLERKILTNIFKYYKDKTFIIVSHRLDNVDLYDKVIKLNSGRVEL